MTQVTGVSPGIVVGAGTEALSAEGKIITAGAIDAHVHFICPQLCHEAISAGITTLLGGGTGPATETNAATCTPGPWNLHRMPEAAEGLPVNLGPEEEAVSRTDAARDAFTRAMRLYPSHPAPSAARGRGGLRRADLD